MKEYKDHTNRHLFVTYSAMEGFQKVRDRLYCKDGTNLSIQAGKYMYSTPRLDGQSHYVSVEVGFPSIQPPNTWAQYAEDWPEGFVKDTLDILRQMWWGIKYSKRLNSFATRYAWQRLIKGKACMTVYAYIPSKLVNEFIEDHGGPDYNHKEKTSNG